MSTEAGSSVAIYKRPDLTREQVDLIKRTICRGGSDDELKLFIATSDRLGLDPFARQIFAVKRWDSKVKREVMAIQVSIDGFRLVAARTGNYAPGPKPSFLEENGRLISATAYVKLFAHGDWHVVEAEAFWDEYVQKTRDNLPNRMWSSMPRVMLGKCAEALALRKAFPAELSGVYTPDEMGQSENDVAAAPSSPAKKAKTLEELTRALPPPAAADGPVVEREPAVVETPAPEDESQDPADAPTSLVERIQRIESKAEARSWMKKHKADCGPDEFAAYNQRLRELDSPAAAPAEPEPDAGDENPEEPPF